MKKSYIYYLIIIIIIIGFVTPCLAEDKIYKIETLQVTNIDPFDKSYTGFIKTLAQEGFVQGKNLKVNRTIVDFDVEKGGIWKKVGVLFRIKSEASRIVDAKPDLVLTIGTPATKYAKDKIVGAGIPLVFTAVAIPEAAGCKSLTEAGPGFTGATLYMNMKDALKIVRLAFPNIKTVGVVHSDDDNAIEQLKQAKADGPSVGLTFIGKEINKEDSIKPALKELIDQGADAFAVPLDSYYGMRKYEPCYELGDVSLKTKIPAFSLCLLKVPGAIMYVGADFEIIGSYSGGHAAKILKGLAKPDDLPVLAQKDLMILVDTKRMQAMGVQLPLGILELAKSVE